MVVEVEPGAKKPQAAAKPAGAKKKGGKKKRSSGGSAKKPTPASIAGPAASARGARTSFDKSKRQRAQDVAKSRVDVRRHRSRHVLMCDVPVCCALWQASFACGCDADTLSCAMDNCASCAACCRWSARMETSTSWRVGSTKRSSVTRAASR